MTFFRNFIFTLSVILLLCCGGNAIADPGVLESDEADALEFLLLYSVSKSAEYLSGGGQYDSPQFATSAADEQRQAELLEEILGDYPFIANRERWGCFVVLAEYPELDLLCNPYSDAFYWKDQWETLISGAAYLEELSIRELKEALEITDEQMLTDAYTGMLDTAYLHLLQFARLLYGNPLAYQAQLLDQGPVEAALAEAMTLVYENFEITARLNDVWYEPASDGQGFSIAVFEDKGTVFLTWYTYDAELPGNDATAIVGDTGQRWLTAQGSYEGKQAELVAYSSSGGLFDSALPVPETEPVGTLFLQFTDCYTGMITYELPGIGRSGSIPIERVASDNVALCETVRAAEPAPVAIDDDSIEPSPGDCFVSEGSAPAKTNQLFAVWGSGSGDVFAVGGAATILHFNGWNWTYMTWGGDFGFEGVWGSSGTDVYAVGGYDGFGLALGVILHYDGNCWREVIRTTDFQFTDVWGSGSDDVFAATSRGPVLHYDGTGWKSMESGTASMDGTHGVWGTGADHVFAVGHDVIWEYDGFSWLQSASVEVSVLRRVWGSSATDVFAVGARYTSQQAIASIFHYNGAGWEFMPSSTGGARWDVWGSGPGDVYVVGDTTGSYGSDQGLISHYDGSAWATTIIENTPTLQGVWGSGPGDVYAVGGGSRTGFCCGGEGTILHFDGATWTTMMDYGNFK